MIKDLNQTIPTSTGEDDHKFSGFNRDWRVRVRKLDEQRPVAPVNGDPVIAPSSVAYTVSVAALEADGTVSKDAAGNLLVFSPRPITIMLGEGGVDVDAALQTAIENRITAGNIHIADQGKLNVSKFTKKSTA